MMEGNGYHVLLAEDNRSLARATSAMLKHGGFDVDVAYDGEEALGMLRSNAYNVAVMDIMMPKMSGLDVLKSIRESGDDIPVLLLTALDTVDNKVTGLADGANDYMTKPFDNKELTARVKALVRGSGASATVSYHDITLDRHRMEVIGKNVSLRMSPEEFGVLETLVNAGGNAVTYERVADVANHGMSVDDAMMYTEFVAGKVSALQSECYVEIGEASCRLVEKE